jgi:hypothetical protein
MTNGGAAALRVPRRGLLLAAAGIAARQASARAQTSRPPRPSSDRWFWRAIAQIEAEPPVGGPSAGAIDHSIFGVEAPRAGRVNPSETPPVLEEFYVRALFGIDATERSDWDIGLVWRLSWEMDALWWSISNDGHWTLSSAIWAHSPRDAEELRAGELCEAPAPPILLQAIVAGSHLAVSVNEGPVIVTTITENREPGQVGILANAREEHLRGNGFTPYREFALWSIASAELPDDYEEWRDPC